MIVIRRNSSVLLRRLFYSHRVDKERMAKSIRNQNKNKKKREMKKDSLTSLDNCELKEPKHIKLCDM